MLVLANKNIGLKPLSASESQSLSTNELAGTAWRCREHWGVEEHGVPTIAGLYKNLHLAGTEMTLQQTTFAKWLDLQKMGET